MSTAIWTIPCTRDPFLSRPIVGRRGRRARAQPRHWRPTLASGTSTAVFSGSSQFLGGGVYALSSSIQGLGWCPRTTPWVCRTRGPTRAGAGQTDRDGGSERPRVLSTSVSILSWRSRLPSRFRISRILRSRDRTHIPSCSNSSRSPARQGATGFVSLKSSRPVNLFHFLSEQSNGIGMDNNRMERLLFPCKTIGVSCSS